jgi:hypothetical protein
MDRCDSLGEFARQHDIGLTTVRGEIKAGRLAARKIGRRTIIAAEDAKAWQDQLPKVQPRVRAPMGCGDGQFDDLIPNAAMAVNLS